jgi:membrane protease YdiL (CAAX protease family)
MPFSSMITSLLFLLIMFTLTCGFVGSWAWAIWRVRHGEAIVPRLLKTGRVLWGLGSVVLVVLMWMAVNLAVIVLYSKATQVVPPIAVKAGKVVGPAVARTLSFTEQMFVVSSINVVLLLTIPVLLRLTSRARLPDLGLVRRNLAQQIFVGTVAFFLVSPFVYVLNALAVLIWKPESHPLEKMVRNELSMGIAELAVLSAVILAPATEELIFRGVIQRWLYRILHPQPDGEIVIEPRPASPETLYQVNNDTELETTQEPLTDLATRPVEAAPSAPPGPIRDLATRLGRLQIQPIVMTSLLFAAVHYPQWPAPLGIFVLSLGLGYVAQQSGSLIAAMVMHSLFNGLGTLLLFMMVQLGGLDLPAKQAKENPPPSCIVPEQTITRFPTHRQVGTVLHFWDQ